MEGTANFVMRITVILLVASEQWVNVTAQKREDDDLLNKTLPLGNSAECRWCINLTEQLEGLRQSSRISNSDLLGLFKDACRKFPFAASAVREECEIGLARNSQKFRKVLEHDASGLKLCEHLHFCEESHVKLNNSMNIPILPAFERSDSDSNTGVFCNTCIHLAERVYVKFIQNFDGSDYTKLMQRLCGHIKNSFVNGMCVVLGDSWDDAHAWMVRELVLEPLYLCRTLELCNDGQLDNETLIHSHQTTCDECREMLEYYKDILDVSSFGLDDSVVDIAKAACVEYGVEETILCEREFLAAMPTTLQKLSVYIEPGVMCQKLDFCSIKDEL